MKCFKAMILIFMRGDEDENICAYLDLHDYEFVITERNNGTIYKRQVRMVNVIKKLIFSNSIYILYFINRSYFTDMRVKMYLIYRQACSYI